MQNSHASTHCLAATAGLLMVLQGCAAPQSDPEAAGPGAEANLGRNEILAWIPRSQAQTPTVARAIAHIALGEAKEATEAELCAGNWVFTGEVRDTRQPQIGLAPQHIGRFPAWHYRIEWNPDTLACEGVSAETYYQALSRHLPKWMMLQGGSPQALFHLGQRLPLGARPGITYQLALNQSH
ncbi:hypothetical protein QVG61_02620 [Thiohalobacter sp. IOR34]|uniref:hypothetical protein n=1 Tax=Thiohalobacter sp. IOR34 TaxID=3057176 RepID=UPI0025B1DC70|nr:hypothetical protein [Thiohalobacter sp. IOR34]WJW76003.1 hypothetical protein QVG61_02620 [Thiohalobacter sp. IOR34]